MPDFPVIAAIVLAGGLSSRMGQDKALLKIQGKPLLQSVCEAAGQQTEKVCIVASQDYRQLIPSLKKCQLILEPERQGPLVGFQRGLEQLQTELQTSYIGSSQDWILLLACDLPNLNGAVLQQWAWQLSKIPSDIMAFLPRHPKGWEPLCGFYRLTCQANLATFIDQGGRSFQAWLKHSQVKEIPNVTPELLFNCNRPGDIELCAKP